ncbi:MAG: phage holin family protein [Candidatus Xenobia bacterium]
MHLLLHWLIDAAVILGVAHLLPGLQVKSFGQALGIAAVVGILGVFISPVVKLVALPLVLLTFGLFGIFVGWIINAILLKLASMIVSEFEITDLGTLFGGALLIAVGEHIGSLLFHLR